MAHFYHLQKSSRCHLYTKSEDHHILQLQIQKLLTPKRVTIEHPFLTIHRIADLIWEQEKIIFEIQCSKIEPFEAEKRIIDYGKMGYQVVWLLDDRLFNKRYLRPAEEFLRDHTAYYFSFARTGLSYFYDQLEIIIAKKRWKKSCPIKVELSEPKYKPALEWPLEIPSQIQKRIATSSRYFFGDLIHRTIRSAIYPSIAMTLARWQAAEMALIKEHRPKHWAILFLRMFFAKPYLEGLNWLVKKASLR